MFHESGVGCSKPHFAISLPGSHLAVVGRQASAAPAGTSWTEVDPPFFAAGAARSGGGMFQAMFHTLYPPFGGRFRPIYPCGKASAKPPNTNPQRAQNAPEASNMKWRYPVLIFGGLCCSAWGFI